MTIEQQNQEPELGDSTKSSGSGFLGPYTPGKPHHYYHRDGVTALEKMRDEAEFRRRDGWGYPQSSIIHLHPAEEACRLPTQIVEFDPNAHEFFPVKETPGEAQSD